MCVVDENGFELITRRVEYAAQLVYVDQYGKAISVEEEHVFPNEDLARAWLHANTNYDERLYRYTTRTDYLEGQMIRREVVVG